MWQRINTLIMTPKISVIHPSRNRPFEAFLAYNSWLSKADNKFEYILSLDNSESEIKQYKSWATPCDVIQSNNKTAIEAINKAAKISKGKIIIVISDDFDCPEHWDTLLLEALKDKSDFVVKTQDGIQKTLITLPIMDRMFYNRFGYIYQPDYIHMGCDVELTAVGLMLGKFINLPLMFTHNHYSVGKSQKDAINEKNDLTYAHGDMILNEHRKNNFGIENPLIQYNEIVWH